MATEPTLSEVIRDAIEARLVDVHTMKVGKVKAYDLDLQVADIEPVMRRPFNIGAGEVDHETLPVLPNVPVIWPRAGGFYMHMPLKVGDFIVIGFTDDNIAQWRQTGSTSEPDDLRRHALGSALAFPGIAPALGVLSINPLDIALRLAGMCFGEDGTDRQVSFASSGIIVGRPNALLKRVSFVALADRTDARLAALEAQVTELTAKLTASTTTLADTAAALGTHTHAGVTVGAGATGVAVQPPPDAPTPPSAFTPNPLTTAADILKGTGEATP